MSNPVFGQDIYATGNGGGFYGTANGGPIYTNGIGIGNLYPSSMGGTVIGSADGGMGNSISRPISGGAPTGMPPSGPPPGGAPPSEGAPPPNQFMRYSGNMFTPGMGGSGQTQYPVQQRYPSPGVYQPYPGAYPPPPPPPMRPMPLQQLYPVANAPYRP